METKKYHAAATRGHANHGWLDSYHTFSFASYHDNDRVHFGALRVINDDVIDGGFGFGKHPHDNMEIITVVLEGALEHQDSMGHKESIVADEVQVMSAGTGLVHSEYNHNKDTKVKLLQIWIFPDKHNVTPRYDQKIFSPEERVNQFQTLVSPIEGNDEGLKIQQQAWIYRTTLQKDRNIELKLHSATHGLYAFMIGGSATINGQLLNNRDGLGISGTENITINTTETADILLLEVPLAGY